MCIYAIQKDKRDKIKCKKTAGICGFTYFCQLSNTYKLTRGAETCTLARKAPAEVPETVPAEVPAEEKQIEKAVEQRAATRRKARAKE